MASLSSHAHSAAQEEEEEAAEEALLSSWGDAPSTSTRTATAYDDHAGSPHASGGLSRQVLHPTVRLPPHSVVLEGTRDTKRD